MDDSLTKSVLAYQAGQAPLDQVRNLVLIEVFEHLRQFRRKGEDEVSDFLLEFHGRIEGLLVRFRCQGVPFRHYLMRTLRWQWNSFRAEGARARRRTWLATDFGVGVVDEELVSEPEPPAWSASVHPSLSAISQKRLVLLALKAAPYLDDAGLESVSRATGVELAWLQACQHRLKAATDRRRGRRAQLVEKRGDAFYRRLVAEDEARRESNPERREVHERRAGLYRSRLANLTHQQNTLSTAPTHLELSCLLGIPKGSVDSSLYHFKKELRGDTNASGTGREPLGSW